MRKRAGTPLHSHSQSQFPSANCSGRAIRTAPSPGSRRSDSGYAATFIAAACLTAADSPSVSITVTLGLPVAVFFNLTFHYGRHAHPACRTHGDQSASAAALSEQFGESPENAAAGRCERMADRNAPSFHIESRTIDAAEGLIQT